MRKIEKLIQNLFTMPEGYDTWLHFAVLIIAVFGIIMIGSASMGDAVNSQTVLVLAIAKQTIFILAGYVTMAAVGRNFRLKHLSTDSFSFLIMIEAFLLVLCLFFPSFNGAKAWIRIPLGVTEVTIQPSEFAKILMYLSIATHFSNRDSKKWDMKQSLYKILMILVPFLVIIIALQGDLGSGVILFLISCFCILIPRNEKMTPLQITLKVLFVVGVIAVFYFFMFSDTEAIIESLPLKAYQKNRISTAINPFVDKYGSGYQLIQSLIAMSTGGWIGLGFGRSVRKYMNFPEATTDYILAIIVEELGFLGFLVVMAVYAFVIFRLLVYARKIKNEAARIILVGCAMYFLVHIFFNVGGVSGMIPLTGIPLPLLSAGGSSAVSFMLSVGLSQAVIAAYHRKEIV